MIVLSLFDWISCGRLALERAWIQVDKYFASEVDPYTIQISKKNFPDNIHIGNITNVTYGYNLPWLPKWKNLSWSKENLDMWQWSWDIDIIIWWSPCQDLSIAKKDGKWLAWEKSSLFFEYVRLLKEIRPKHFLLENVASMRKADREEITRILTEIYPDTQCIMINSALVSAQNRKRLYWSNISGGGAITQPEDKGIYLRDILEDIPFDYDEYMRHRKAMDDQEWPDADLFESNSPKKAGSLIWKEIPGKYLTDKVKLQLRQKSLSITASYQKKNDQNYFEKSEWQIIVSEKAYPVTATYAWACPRDFLEKHQRELVIGVFQVPRGKNEWWLAYEWEKSPTMTWSFEDNSKIVVRIPEATQQGFVEPEDWDVVDLWYPSSTTKRWRLMKSDGKCNTLCASMKFHLISHYFWRKLTPIECERLQTLPDNYTNVVSNSQRYKAIGNGWTVDVIAHIFRFIK